MAAALPALPKYAWIHKLFVVQVASPKFCRLQWVNAAVILTESSGNPYDPRQILGSIVCLAPEIVEAGGANFRHDSQGALSLGGRNRLVSLDDLKGERKDESLESIDCSCVRDDYDCEPSILVDAVCKADHGRAWMEAVPGPAGIYALHHL